MTENRHPEELLAGYVDGSLTERERAAVESHLTTCARCRQECALALRALEGLRELPEESVPFGVMNPVTAEIERRMSRTPPRPLSQRVLWAASGAVAAAFVGLLAVWVLPNLGAGAANEAAGEAAAKAPNAGVPRSEATASAGAFAGAAAPVPLEHTSADYDDAALRALATRIASEVGSSDLARATQPGAEPSQAQSAAACLAKGAGVEPQAVLVRLISARYKTQPVIIGVYLTGPGPGRPPDEAIVWVVRTDTCAIASFTQVRI